MTKTATNRALHGMATEVRLMTMMELVALTQAPDLLTQTNCGWTSYHVRKVVAAQASWEGSRRILQALVGP